MPKISALDVLETSLVPHADKTQPAPIEILADKVFAGTPAGELPVNVFLRHYSLPFTLRSDQRAEINLLSLWNRTGCYMDVGLGKTVVATTCALYHAICGRVEQVLVLVPPILIEPWQEWLEGFEGVSVLVYRGAKAKRKELDLSADFIITTLGLFKNDFDRFQAWSKTRKVMLIVDEAAAIRRTTTLNWHAVRDFMFRPQHFLMLLTGTAINRPYHCYGYIKLISPEIYRSFPHFQSMHVLRDADGEFLLDEHNEPLVYTNLELLARNMLRQSVRVLAEEVLTLPEVIPAPVRYDLPPLFRRVYDQFVEQQLLELEDGTVIDGTTPQRMYNAAQKLLLTPIFDKGAWRYPEAFGLIDEMAEEAGMLSGGSEKLIIFNKYQDSNDGVFRYIQSIRGLQPVLIYGKNTPKQNADNIQRFLKDPAVNIAVGNPRSLGVGLNLQHVCRMILYLELPLTSNDYAQTLGRIKREGQTRACLLKFAIAKATIQTKLIHNLLSKEALIQEIMPTRETLRRALLGEED